MTNNEIIISEAIKHGIYTKAEAQAIVAAKGCLPIHPDNHCGAVCATAERNNVHFQSFTLSGRSVLSNSITHTSGFAFQPSV